MNFCQAKHLVFNFGLVLSNRLPFLPSYQILIIFSLVLLYMLVGDPYLRLKGIFQWLQATTYFVDAI